MVTHPCSRGKDLGHSQRSLVARFASKKFRSAADPNQTFEVRDGKRTPGKIALFATCYVNYNEPGIGHDFVAVLEHNQVPWTVAEKECAAACRS